jgi:glycosyltransferase involved in cell wall biosynthesis
MRILVVSNMYPPDMVGGYELLCSNAVAALRQRGHEVVVLTSSTRGAPTLGRQEGVLRHLEVADIWNPHVMSRLDEPALSIHRARAGFVIGHNAHTLVDVLRDFEPDVVYLWNLDGLGGLALAYTVQTLGHPWVWDLMDCVPRLLCTWQERPAPVLISEFNRVMHGRYMAVSQGTVDEITDAGLLLQDSVTLMPVWVSGATSPFTRTRFHRPGDHLRIVFASVLTRAKGIDIALDVARLLKQAGRSDFSLDVFGNALEGRVEEMITSAGVADCVTVRGFVPQADLLRSYLDYDVFLFPTHAREPFAVAPLEAITQGCVPVLTDNCGNAEWLVDNVHCVKAPRNAEAFAGRILDILAGDVDLEGIARRAAVAVRRDFSAEPVVSGRERILAEAAAQGRRAPLHEESDLRRLIMYVDNLTRLVVPALAAPGDDDVVRYASGRNARGRTL